jgi:hypothetical protein
MIFILSQVVLKDFPVAAIEGLPLRSGVDEPEGCSLVGGIHKIGSGGQMSTCKVIVNIFDVVGAQRGRTQNLTHSYSLRGLHWEKISFMKTIIILYPIIIIRIIKKSKWKCKRDQTILKSQKRRKRRISRGWLCNLHALQDERGAYSVNSRGSTYAFLN